MPPADDSLLSISTSSSNVSPSREPSHGHSLSPSPGPTHTSASQSPSTPAIDPDAPVSSIASSAPPSPPSTADGSDAHLTDGEFAQKMDQEVLRLGEVTDHEAKLNRREDWLREVRDAAQTVRDGQVAVKVEDGEETEQGEGGKGVKGEAAFLRQSHRYLTKQLKSLETDDWMFSSAEPDVNTPWNQDRLFVPATQLNMAAGKRGWGNERDAMDEDATMEIVGQDDGEVWGRSGR